ncbi:MAG: hypothetical protein AAF727_08770 [Pseudomonadota bacterium]
MSRFVRFRVLAVLLACVLSVACTPQPRTFSPDQVSTAAILLEARVNADRGKIIGNDFRVRGATRKNNVVTMNLQMLNERVVALARQQPDLFGRITTAVIARDLCSARNTRDLINSGLQLNIRFFVSANRSLFTSAINRC